MYFIKVTLAAITNKPTNLVANPIEVLGFFVSSNRQFVCFYLLVFSLIQEFGFLPP